MRKTVSQLSSTRLRVYRAVAGIIFLGLLVIAWSVNLGVRHMVWVDYTGSSVGNLAMFIKIFRDDRGSYPTSLEELLQKEDSERRVLISELLNRRILGTTNHYEYRPSSNSFVIIATKPGGLLHSAEKLEKQYKADELP